MRRMGAKELRDNCSDEPNTWVKTSTRKRACHPCKAINYTHTDIFMHRAHAPLGRA